MNDISGDWRCHSFPALVFSVFLGILGCRSPQSLLWRNIQNRPVQESIVPLPYKGGTLIALMIPKPDQVFGIKDGSVIQYTCGPQVTSWARITLVAKDELTKPTTSSDQVILYPPPEKIEWTNVKVPLRGTLMANGSCRLAVKDQKLYVQLSIMAPSHKILDFLKREVSSIKILKNASIQ